MKQQGSPLIAYFYDPETTPLTQAITALRRGIPPFTEPLLLVSALFQAEECFLAEVLAPFLLLPALSLGLIHRNAAFLTAELLE